MRTGRSLVIGGALAMLLTAGTVGGAMAGDPTVSKPYSVPVGDAFYFASATGQPAWAGPVQACAAPFNTAGKNVGGACFKVFGPNKVTITIKDDNVAKVGASLDVYDSSALDPNPISSQ